MATKIHRVGIRIGDHLTEHLVRANSSQQAQNHVTQGMVTVEVAEPDDIYRLAKDGVKLQDATAQAAAPAAPAAKTPKGGK